MKKEPRIRHIVFGLAFVGVMLVQALFVQWRQVEQVSYGEFRSLVETGSFPKSWSASTPMVDRSLRSLLDLQADFWAHRHLATGDGDESFVNGSIACLGRSRELLARSRPRYIGLAMES